MTDSSSPSLVPRPSSPIPGNITSVGSVVRRGESVLLVRLTYGPTKGRYSFPGGWQDVGEDLHTAAVREVREETGIEARSLGLIAVRTRTEPEHSIVDLVWLLEHVSGDPKPDDEEADDARFMPFDEAEQRDDVVELVPFIVGRLRAGELRVLREAGDNRDGAPGRDPEDWTLFA